MQAYNTPPPPFPVARRTISNALRGARLRLNFLNPVLDPRITFSRGTGATRVNASGFIETVGNTTPRFDYDPVTLAPRGLLIEEARTNLLIYSAQFDTGWATVNTTVAANATISPDGTVNADKITPTATVAAHQIAQSSGTLTVGTVYTASAFVKAAGYNFVDLTGNTPNANFLAQFNLSTGSVVSSTNVTGTPTIQNFGNGWYRIVASFTCATATGGFYYIQVRDNSQALSYAGDGTSGVFAYGAQLEAGSFATSYIPTVASTVTRNGDIATMTGTNFSSWYNQSEGTIVWSGDFAVNNSNRLVSIDAGVSARTADIYGTGAGALSYYKTSDLQQIQFGSGVALNTVFTAAVAIKLNDYIGAVNGATGGADTTTGAVAVADRLSLGHWNNSGFLNGHIRVIAYFNTRLPNAQLQTLTAPSLATTLSLDFTSGSYNVGF